VSQSKFTVLNIMSRKIFGEFMEFFLKGLNPFKIQTIVRLEFLLEFKLLPKLKVVPFEVFYHHDKFGICWSPGSTLFIFFNLESVPLGMI
jgi:hypothetical protein